MLWTPLELKSGIFNRGDLQSDQVAQALENVCIKTTNVVVGQISAKQTIKAHLQACAGLNKPPKSSFKFLKVGSKKTEGKKENRPHFKGKSGQRVSKRHRQIYSFQGDIRWCLCGPPGEPTHQSAVISVKSGVFPVWMWPDTACLAYIRRKRPTEPTILKRSAAESGKKKTCLPIT